MGFRIAMRKSVFASLAIVGACAMTTKVCRQQKVHFQNSIVVAFPMRKGVLDNFPLCPPAHPPPEKRKFYFYCRLAFSGIGVCDSNRIAHRGCVARFGPISGGTLKGTSILLSLRARNFHSPVSSREAHFCALHHLTTERSHMMISHDHKLLQK